MAQTPGWAPSGYTVPKIIFDYTWMAQAPGFLLVPLYRILSSTIPGWLRLQGGLLLVVVEALLARGE